MRLNNYFCIIGSNLADSIICTTRKQPKYFLEKKVSDSIYLELPTNNENLNQITTLKNKAVRLIYDIRTQAKGRRT